MSDFVIVTDSAADLPLALVQELDLTVVPLRFTFGETTYEDHPDRRDMAIEAFYDRLRKGEMATTSAINVGDYQEALRPILESGRDVLLLVFTSALSTTYQSAVIATEELKEEFPERKIMVVDTLAASAGQGLLVYLTVEEKKKGASLEEAAAFAEATKLKISHWFTVDDLVYLKRGGRISPAAALVGNALGIKPVMHVDNEGHLIPVSKVRGRKNALSAIANKYGELAVDPAGGVVFISHGDCLSEVKVLEGMLQEKYGAKVEIITDVGTVIGAHSGPGTIALFFVSKER